MPDFEKRGGGVHSPSGMRRFDKLECAQALRGNVLLLEACLNVLHIHYFVRDQRPNMVKLYIDVLRARRNLVASTGGYGTQVVLKNHGRRALFTLIVFSKCPR